MLRGLLSPTQSYKVSDERRNFDGLRQRIEKVSRTAALQAIAEGPDGKLAALGKGKTLIEMSTVSPEFSSARGVSAHFMP